jgi:GNAT superfamily N-acetyltransferase
MVPDCVIRPYDPSDEAAVAALISQVWGRDWADGELPAFGADADSTVVAETSRRVIGFGSLWTNGWHPGALYAAVGVAPAKQGRGVGTQLMDHLLTLRGSRNHLPLLTGILENNRRGAQFLVQYGFVPVQQTWQCVLPIGSWGEEDRSRLHRLHAGITADCKRGGYSIVPLSELRDNPELDLRVAALCANIYSTTHTINPPSTQSAESWRDLIFSNPDDPLLEEGSFVAMRGAEFAAVALLHPGTEPGFLELGWRGVGDGHHLRSGSLVLALTLEQVFYALQRACHLQAEIDSTDPWALLLHKTLPFLSAPAWVTWRRLPDP